MDPRATFYHSLSVGLGAGLTVRKALESLRRPDLAALTDGRPLSAVLEAGGFPVLDLAVVRAAEETGRLDRALKQLSEAAEAGARLRRRLRNAAIYPVALLHAAVLIPWIAGWFMGYADPASLLFGLLGVWGLVGAATAILISPLRLHIPFIGDILRELALARFCRALAWTLDAGVPLQRALTLAADSAGEPPGGPTRRAATAGLGRPLHQILAHTLPSLSLEMVRAGEEAGSADRMLGKAAAVHEGTAGNRLAIFARMAPLVFFLLAAIGMVAAIASLAPALIH